MTDNQQVVVEWAPFELKAGASPADLQAASAQLQQAFLQHQPGYLQRDLLQSADRKYIDLVYWASPEAAQTAMQAAMEHPACQAYFQLMEVDETAIAHFSLLSSYRPSATEA